MEGLTEFVSKSFEGQNKPSALRGAGVGSLSDYPRTEAGDDDEMSGRGRDLNSSLCRSRSVSPRSPLSVTDDRDSLLGEPIDPITISPASPISPGNVIAPVTPQTQSSQMVLKHSTQSILSNNNNSLSVAEMIGLPGGMNSSKHKSLSTVPAPYRSAESPGHGAVGTPPSSTGSHQMDKKHTIQPTGESSSRV